MQNPLLDRDMPPSTEVLPPNHGGGPCQPQQWLDYIITGFHYIRLTDGRYQSELVRVFYLICLLFSPIVTVFFPLPLEK